MVVGQNLLKALKNELNARLKSLRIFFSFRNNSAKPTAPPTPPATTPSLEQYQAEYCPTVKPSDRVDCAGLFPGNHAVHNKAGCESLGCCHNPINVAGPWCFQAPWTPTRGRRSGKYLNISQLNNNQSSVEKSTVKTYQERPIFIHFKRTVHKQCLN